MSDITIGKLIAGIAKRDAIHVAVAPVIAAEDLTIGQHVGLLPDGRASATVQAIGIVDPFLMDDVEPGQKFWLFLYPKTIQNLRHDWDHPAFVAPVIASESEAWLRLFATDIGYGLSFEQMIEAANNYQKDYTTIDHPNKKYEWDIPEEFWEHWEKFTGKKAENKETFFTCCP